MKTHYFLFGMILLGACAGPVQNDKTNDTLPENDAPGEADAPVQVNAPMQANAPGQANAVYQLILNNDTIPGKLDKNTIGGLREPLRALAAFYAAMGGTNCDGENCELTTALGLGKQGSDEHKKLIKAYFPGDSVASTVLRQDCYLRPSGASTFSDFEYLTFSDQGDTVKVDYSLMYYNQGKTTHTSGPDVYLFKDDTFKKLKRNLWTHVERQ